MNLLLINDNSDNYILISDLLINDSVDFANQYNIANQKIMMNSYDLILLDPTLVNGAVGDLSGNIKASTKNSSTPVILITDSVVNSKINAIKMGAVDYISKPINIFELQTKIAEQLSKKKDSKLNKNAEVRRGNVSMNFVQHEISCSGIEGDFKYKLTPTEFKLFYYLFENANRLIDRNDIYNKIWKKKTTETNLRIVDKHLTAIRKKVCQRVFKIEAVHGSGYRMTVAEMSCANFDKKSPTTS